ncbi:MAG: acyl-CoA thioesterase, partial [Planctomycetales bacterium]|nr:acyl-CoA thioesterase [Planctomycetales bacterium]
MAQRFRTTRRVEFRDTDAAGIAHFSVYFNYMEEAEHALWRHLGLSVEEASADHVVSWPRVSAKCDYQSAARFEETLDIEVAVARLGEKSVTFRFALTRDGGPIAAGEVTAVCCRFAAHQP